jgi:hypothetical protein
MTKHLSPIEFKSDGGDADPIEVVTKAISDLTKTVDERLTKLETKSDDKDGKDKKDDVIETKALAERLDKLEAKANRPGVKPGDEQKDIETKALASYIRTGSDVEVKAAASDSAVDGGWMVLPTIDLSIRELMTDISPMRGLAEVVSISTSEYQRFYSLGARGAQWVAERDDRPQDTDRPKLIKHSYGVAERLRSIVDSNGRFLWAPTGNLIDGIEHPLLGYAGGGAVAMPASAMRPAAGEGERSESVGLMSLLNLKQVAERLGCSEEQARGLVEDGDLPFINIGRGKKRPTMRFSDEDIQTLIERRRRTRTPCLSTSPRNHRSISMTSRPEVIGFMAQRNARLAERQKNSKP